MSLQDGCANEIINDIVMHNDLRQRKRKEEEESNQVKVGFINGQCNFNKMTESV
jgi:hypothetical protein